VNENVSVYEQGNADFIKRPACGGAWEGMLALIKAGRSARQEDRKTGRCRMKTVHCVISGQVQGVFFRAWTRNQACELGVAGWVRNLPSGQVEVLAQATDEILTAFLELLRQGPPLARVDRVNRDFLDDAQPMTGFVIRR